MQPGLVVSKTISKVPTPEIYKSINMALLIIMIMQLKVYIALLYITIKGMKMQSNTYVLYSNFNRLFPTTKELAHMQATHHNMRFRRYYSYDNKYFL